MRKIRMPAVALCLVLATGCGNLRARVVTNRDLTKDEVAFYQEQEDGFRLVVLYPIVTWGKTLVGAGGDEMLMGRIVAALNLPIPILGFGYSSLTGAVFDDEGKRTGRFGATGFAPLFMHMGFKMKENNDDPWMSVVSYTSFLGIFGYGSCGDQKIVKALFTFGASEEDILEAMPDPWGLRD